MNTWGIGLSLVSVMIIIGIITSGTVTETLNNPDNIQYFEDNNILPPDFDNLLEQLDINVTNQIDDAFVDSNLSPGIKSTIHYVTKGMIYAMYTDFYIGQSINEYVPFMYSWIKENMIIVMIIILLLIYPEVITLLIFSILALIFIIKERFFNKPKERKTEWREK